MTEAEIEAKLESLGEQLSQLHKEQQSRDKTWRKIGPASLLLASGFAILQIIISIVQLSSHEMVTLTLVQPVIPLLFLGIALQAGVKTPVGR